VEGKNKV